jgi:hypothetical protein
MVLSKILKSLIEMAVYSRKRRGVKRFEGMQITLRQKKNELQAMKKQGGRRRATRKHKGTRKH